MHEQSDAVGRVRYAGRDVRRPDSSCQAPRSRATARAPSACIIMRSSIRILAVQFNATSSQNRAHEHSDHLPLHRCPGRVRLPVRTRGARGARFGPNSSAPQHLGRHPRRRRSSATRRTAPPALLQHRSVQYFETGLIGPRPDRLDTSVATPVPINQATHPDSLKPRFPVAPFGSRSTARRHRSPPRRRTWRPQWRSPCPARSPRRE